MHFRIILRIIGTLLMVFSLTLLVPAIIGWLSKDGAAGAFIQSFFLTFSSGTVMWLFVRRQRSDLNIRDGFLIVALFWGVLGLFGALPFALAEATQLSPSNAIFESISGLTTTGATVITGLDELPISILFYRQLLQWLGGIGIIVIASLLFISL